MTKPDVALVDINLPGMNGIECVAKLKAQLPSLQILDADDLFGDGFDFQFVARGRERLFAEKSPGGRIDFRPLNKSMLAARR